MHQNRRRRNDYCGEQRFWKTDLHKHGTVRWWHSCVHVLHRNRKRGGVNSNTYGLDTGTSTSIPENADFNSYTTPGNYYVASATLAGTIQNYPPHPANAGTLKVEGTSGSGRKQYFKPWNSPRSYQRSYYNSAWTPWFSADTVMQYYITTTMGGFDGLDSLLTGMGASQAYIASVADNGSSDGGSNSRPTSSNFWLVFGTINANGKYAQQLAMSFDNSGNIYRRIRNNSDTWSAWKTFFPS